MSIFRNPARRSAQEVFSYLGSAVEHLATADVPIPYNPSLMEAVVPTVEKIGERIERVMKF